MQTVGSAGTLLKQTFASPGKLAQTADRSGWNEACAHRAICEALRPTTRSMDNPPYAAGAGGVKNSKASARRARSDTAGCLATPTSHSRRTSPYHCNRDVVAPASEEQRSTIFILRGRTEGPWAT